MLDDVNLIEEMDIHNFGGRLERGLALLAKSGIDSNDKDLILQFVEQKAAEKVKAARQDKYLRTLRLIDERYMEEQKSFLALEKRDIIKIVTQIERSELSEWTKHDYELMLKIFMIWLDKKEEVEWLKIKSPRNLPSDILDEQDITTMIDAALTLRDKAFIAMLYEGGFRVGEIGGLTIKDISFDHYGAIAIVNGKTGMRRVRLIWSTPYISQWLEVHPKRDDKKAAVWLKNNGDEMNYGTIKTQLRKIAKRAGIEKRVNPHNFRHSRSTHLASKLTESQMDEYLGWVQGSRMPAIYVHLSGRDLDGDLLKMYGLEQEHAAEEELAMQKCPHCNTVNTIGARRCVNCQKPLRVEEVVKREEQMREMFEDFMDMMAERPELLEKFQKVNSRK